MTANLIYLNHAAVGALSKKSFEAMQRHARGQRDHGVRDWREWNETILRLRKRGATILGADPADVAIFKNTTEGLSLVASGLEWESGDNVVLSDMEFPSNELPWLALRDREVECRRIETREGTFDVDDVARLIDDNTRVVSVSSVSFHNGFRPDLKGISAICREGGAFLVVDAIQSVGALEIDVAAQGIDFLAADGHKWMLGPEGVALFYASAAGREALGPWPVGWRSLERPRIAFGSDEPVTTDARRFEGGVVNTNGCYGLEASLETLLEIGIDRIEREVVRLSGELERLLRGIGWEILSPLPIRSGIVTARPKPMSDEAVIDLEERFAAEGVAVAGRMGGIRFSPHFYNSDEELERAVDVAARIST